MEPEENKNEYEIAFLLKEEADLKDLLALLRQYEAEITFEGAVKKIALAYEIEKQTSAYFGFIRFTAPANRIPELDKALVLFKQVLRSMVVRYVPGPTPSSHTSTVVSAEATEATAPMAAAQAESVSPSSSHSLPLSNEDLEKKIEEILK